MQIWHSFVRTKKRLSFRNCLSMTNCYRVASDVHHNRVAANTWDPAAVYGNSSDVRHQAATFYGSYQLPFGKGKQF